MTHQIATIARYTLLEAIRTRLPLTLIIVLALLGAATLFAGGIAITETGRMQTGIYAAGARFTSVFILAMYVLASFAREFNDKGLDIALALDLPRGHYICGKLAGFLLAALAVAAVASVPLLILVPFDAVLKWSVSLALEVGIVAALALFCGVTFRQPFAGACFVMGFYLLARTLTAIRLMSAHPVMGAEALTQDASRMVADGLALVVPALDAWTQTAWLVGGPPTWAALAALGVKSVLYVAFLGGAAMFDFYRRNL